MRRVALSLLAIALLLARSAGARADLATFTGFDPGVAPGAPHPNSDGARMSFDAAAGLLGNLGIIDFENQTPVSPAPVLSLAPGVTYTPTNPDASSGIFDSDDLVLGFNTTPGGTKHLRYSTSSTTDNDGTFSFATPIEAFGAYFTGVGTSGGDAFVVFNDGTSQSFQLAPSSAGGVEFFGFTDPGQSITSVAIRQRVDNGDIFGIDDVRFVVGGLTPDVIIDDASVPEPGTLALLGISTLGLVGYAYCRRNKRRASAP